MFDDLSRAGSGHSDAVAALLTVVRARGYSRRDEPFRLSSGELSRDYVDMRRAVARGEDLRVAADAVISLFAELEVGFDAFGGPTMGADPVSHAVALTLGCEWFSVRKTVKSHGSQQRIEGARLSSGRRVVLFEDTVSTGGSFLEAAAIVSATGAEIALACTLLDRGEAAGPAFAALGIRYLRLLTYADLGIEPIVPAGDIPGTDAR